MTTFTTMHDLLEDQLRDILGAERAALRSYPRFTRAAQHPELKAALEEHRRMTEQQVERVSRALELLGGRTSPKPCKAMNALIEEGEELAEAEGSGAVRDAALIIAAQRMEHYEISAYGSAVAHAERLGLRDVARLLSETLEEEKRTDQLLNELAERDVNEVAMAELRMVEEAEGGR